MKTRWMTMVLGGLLLAGCGGKDQAGQPPTSEDEFVEALAFAINSKDMGKYKQLLHPKVLAGITDENRPVMDRAHAGILRGLILVGGKRVLKPVPAGDLKELPPTFNIPVPPTHILEIDMLHMSQAAPSVVQSAHLIRVEDGKWWLVEPIPTAETIARMKAAAAKRKRPKMTPAEARERHRRRMAATQPTTGVARTRPPRPARPAARTKPTPRAKRPAPTKPTPPPKGPAKTKPAPRGARKAP